MADKNDLRDRTKAYALRIIRLVDSLPRKRSVDVIAGQIVRSGTSVGAQYREGYRAKSKPDYVSKLSNCIGELDETRFWLELLVEGKIVSEEKLNPLIGETAELIAIFTTIVRKVKQAQ